MAYPKVERVVPTRFDVHPRLAPKRMGTMRSTRYKGRVASQVLAPMPLTPG
jgi:hypothetical protein